MVESIFGFSKPSKPIAADIGKSRPTIPSSGQAKKGSKQDDAEDPKLVEGDENIAKERRFQKQCFLIRNM